MNTALNIMDFVLQTGSIEFKSISATSLIILFKSVPPVSPLISLIKTTPLRTFQFLLVFTVASSL